MDFAELYSLILGLIIVIEAIFVLIGMYATKEKTNEWKTRFNTNTLLLDIAFGVIIIFNSMEKMNFIALAVIILGITHLYREIEYFNKSKKSKLLKNYPLFVMNSIKLLGLLGMLYLIF